MQCIAKWVLSTGPAAAQTITEIIDATGNPLTLPLDITIDGSGRIVQIATQM